MSERGSIACTLLHPSGMGIGEYEAQQRTIGAKYETAYTCSNCPDDFGFLPLQDSYQALPRSIRFLRRVEAAERVASQSVQKL